MVYCSSEPYPPIQVEGKNLFYANLLLEDYAGLNGELTAITLYSYQNFSLFTAYPHIAEALSKIAMTEMHHLALLGKTIKLLGLNPFYKYPQYGKYHNWQASLNYNSNVSDILKINIKHEQTAINNYLYHISIIKDKYIQKLLYRIIADEKIHIACFKTLLKTLSSTNNF